MDAPNIWNNYPSELLAEAEASNVEAERQILSRTPIDPDPYNVPMSVLIARWLQRKSRR